MTIQEFFNKHNISIHIVSGLKEYLKIDESIEMQEIAFEEAFYLFTGKKLKKSEQHKSVSLQENETTRTPEKKEKK